MFIYYAIMIVVTVVGVSLLYYFKVTGKYKDILYHINKENAALDKDINKTAKEIKQLAREESELNEECLARGGASWEGFSADDFGGDSNAIADFFLNMGKISQEDLTRAEAVCTDAEGKYTLEDTLVLLDMVSKSDLEWAKKKI